MMGIERPPQPAVLAEHGNKFKDRYLQRLDEYRKNKGTKKPSFIWYKVNGKPLNQILLPLLVEMTANHCSYCDGFPLGSSSRQTIDHFKPKEIFPDDAYAWDNLFHCCDRCQEVKSCQYSEELWKPDQPSYGFEHYFLFNYSSGQIEVNPFASPESRLRAEATLEMLDLNDRKRGLLPEARLRTLEDSQLNPNRDPNDWPYRFISS